MNIAAFEQMGNFLEQIFSVRKKHHDGQHGHSERTGAIGFSVKAEGRETGKREQARKDCLAQQGVAGGKEQNEGQGKMVVEDQQGAQ